MHSLPLCSEETSLLHVTSSSCVHDVSYLSGPSHVLPKNKENLRFLSFICGEFIVQFLQTERVVCWCVFVRVLSQRGVGCSVRTEACASGPISAPARRAGWVDSVRSVSTRKNGKCLAQGHNNKNRQSRGSNHQLPCLLVSH